MEPPPDMTLLLEQPPDYPNDFYKTPRGDLDGKKDLPPEAAQVLKDWMLNHFHNPYPTPTVRIMPAHIARMSLYLCTATSRWRVQALTHCHSPFPLPHATYTATYTAAPPPPLCLRAWMQLSNAWL